MTCTRIPAASASPSELSGSRPVLFSPSVNTTISL